MEYYGILCDSSLDVYFSNNEKNTNNHYLYYKNNYVYVDSYINIKENNETQRKSVRIEKRLNYYWYNYVLYNDIIYNRITWGVKDLRLCTNDSNGMIAGNYWEHISSHIENYGEENAKIKNRLINTMNVLESMLKQQKVNYNQKFKRYNVDETSY